MELRKRGYDVCAGRSIDGYTMSDYGKLFEPPSDMYKNIVKYNKAKTDKQKDKCWDNFVKAKKADDYCHSYLNANEYRDADAIQKAAKNIRDYFNEAKPGDSGIYCGSYKNYRSGHCIHWTKLNDGTVRFEDGQIAKQHDGYDAMMKFYNFSSIGQEVQKLSGKEPNWKAIEDMNYIREVTPRKEVKVVKDDKDTNYRTLPDAYKKGKQQK